jgi:hypothetical protein
MKKKTLVTILLLLICCLPAVFPLLHHGFFKTDDGEWMIIRLSAFYQALHDGQFPVRVLERLNFGYGYPVSEFLYPGGFYVASIFHIIRFGFVNAIKILYGISLIGAGIFTYLWLSRLFSKYASFVGALVTLYLPYHLYDVYTRGSIEVFALLWVPFILWQLERKSIFFSALGIALLMLSHNTLSALFLPLIVCYILLEIAIHPDRRRGVFYYGNTLLLGIGMTAFFWLPIVGELRYTVFSSTEVSDWKGYFASVDLVGYVTFFILLIILVLLLARKIVLTKHRLTILFFIFSLIAIVMATNISTFLWYVLPAGFIQFPFRFLSLLVVSIPFLAAYLVSTTKGKLQLALTICLLMLLAYSAAPFSAPKEYFDKGEAYYYTNDATTTVKDEYMPVWVKEKPLQKFTNKVEVIQGKGEISHLVYTNKKITFAVDSKSPITIQINTIYWPGWYVLVDNNLQQIAYRDKRGLIQFPIAAGKHIISVTFGESPIRWIGDTISIISFGVLIICSRRYNKKR